MQTLRSSKGAQSSVTLHSGEAQSARQAPPTHASDRQSKLCSHAAPMPTFGRSPSVRSVAPAAAKASVTSAPLRPRCVKMPVAFRPTQVEASFVWLMLPPPPRETTPTSAPRSENIGPPLSPLQIDSPVSSSESPSPSSVRVSSTRGPINVTEMPLRWSRVSGREPPASSPHPTSVSFSLIAAPLATRRGAVRPGSLRSRTTKATSSLQSTSEGA